MENVSHDINVRKQQTTINNIQKKCFQKTNNTSIQQTHKLYFANLSEITLDGKHTGNIKRSMQIQILQESKALLKNWQQVRRSNCKALACFHLINMQAINFTNIFVIRVIMDQQLQATTSILNILPTLIYCKIIIIQQLIMQFQSNFGVQEVEIGSTPWIYPFNRTKLQYRKTSRSTIINSMQISENYLHMIAISKQQHTIYIIHIFR
eukprot:TRINITY_DN4616_c0_g1_i3.p2 TRINITY_DN4616_c0_g1~~TRINITY_DN4616_c0_g1_i3.p2  ORF type:complete len:208 (+),score=-22.55 TRINITY_DN4616_c0_g1_i3:1289-1912(+)